MFLDDQGIVLQVVRYDDRSSVVHIFTRSHGTVPFIVTRPKSRLSPGSAVHALMAPLHILSFQWDMKPTGTLFRMKDVHAAAVWQTIPYHPVKRAIALLLGEYMAAMLREEGENALLFDHIVQALRWLDTADDGFANFHLVFLLEVARILGIAPDTDSFVRGYAFDIEAATFVPYAPATPFVMTAPDADLLYRLIRTDYPAMTAIRMARTDRSRLLNYLTRFFTCHLPAFPDIKSLEVLETLFENHG